MNHTTNQYAKGIVLVDICGTLYNANTTMTFLDYSFMKNKKYNIFRKLSKTFFIRILNTLIFKFFKYDCIRRFGISFLRGMNKTEINKLVDKYYDNFLQHKILFKPTQILNNYRKNYRIVLVSATLDCIAQKVALEMGITDYLSSKLNYKNDVCCGALEFDLLFNKLTYLKQLGYGNSYEMTLSDNISDVELMRLSKENYIVTTKKNLNIWHRITVNKKISNYKIILVQ